MPSDSEQAPIRAEKLILIVEDDTGNRDILELILTSMTPYQVRCAQSAEEALQLINEEKPDLLLLDQMLPRMKGTELYDYVQTIPNLSTLPALLMSVHNLSSATVKRPHLTFLAKPFELETFLETIHSLLGAAGALPILADQV